MDHFKLLIRLFTKQGCRSDIAFDFDAESEGKALEAAVRACLERADMNATAGGISQLDISLCDCRSNMLEQIRIRPEGGQAMFEHDDEQERCRHCFTLLPEDSEMFHLAAHGLLTQMRSHRSPLAASLR
ncbi:MAG TPA: hypothetical protein VF798_11690 [Burkholderiaceae bacterium]